MKYKLSSYLVFSEMIIRGEYVLMYSTVSTTMMLLKVSIYNILKESLFHDLDSELIQILVTNKVLVNPNVNELETIIQDNKNAIKSEDSLFQVISPSANCQLGCGYCGQVHTKTQLDDNFQEKIIARISQSLSAKDYKKIQIGWFGAEPLMGLKSIKALTVDLKKLALKNNCVYSSRMVTNGLSLKREIFYDLVENFGVSSFEITIDGTAEHHDLRRHTKLQEKTFALIIRNLKNIIQDERFVSSKGKITIRANVDRANHNSILDLIDLLDDEKILNSVSFYTAAIHSWGNDAHLNSLSQVEYAEFEITVIMKLIEKKHQYTVLPGIKTHIVCTSLHDNAEVFDAEGNVYNCTEISQVEVYENNDYYKVGKLNDIDYINSERPFSEWNDDILRGEVPCTTCRILPICGGGCPKLWKEGISPCPPIKYNIEQRLLLEFSKNKDMYLKSTAYA